MSADDPRLVEDAEARRAIGHDLDDTLVIEAAAGTGKTTELIHRILRVLVSGRAVMTEIVAVTFTEKAAGELRLRVRERLEHERAAAESAEDRRRLERALATLEEAHVNTIHGFCAELMRERPVEAGVDPLFRVLTEPEAKRLYDKAFREWLQETLKDPPEGVRRALRRTSAPVFGASGDGGPVDRLRGAGYDLAQNRDFQTPWHRPPFDRSAQLTLLIRGLHRLAELSAGGSSRDNLFVDLDGVRRLSTQIKLETEFGQQDLDGWEARLVDLVRDRGFSRTRKGTGYKFSGDASRQEVLDARQLLFDAMIQFRRDADADLAAALQQELKGATERYTELKDAAGALDFIDLLARTRDLVRDNAEVRTHLQAKFTHIFVDEFQDTDPLQAEILLLLAADDPRETDASRARPQPGKLFLVGDPKQAIYRFRGTDVATYWKVSEQIRRRGGRVLQLTRSYRSVPEIQRFVNAAFEGEMVADEVMLQPDYVPLSPDRAGYGAQPAIVALPVPRPYSTRGFNHSPSAWAIDDSLPDAVGAYIAWLVDPSNGWTIAEPVAGGGERRVPLAARHIAVLFRRFSSFGEDMTRAYTDAIEARGIPHLLVGGKSFHNKEEVESVRAALAAIEWPDDELSVFATLRGALFAIDDETLLQFRDRFKVVHPFRIPRVLGGNSGQELELSGDEVSHLMPVAEALRLLRELHRRRNYRPVADTIAQLLEATRAHVGFILRPAGEQALANVLHVAEIARQYEASGGISFRGFIDELRNAAQSESAEAPILEENSDGVRIMTVHKAKGLEFPVVILADLTCRLSRDDASRYLDLERRLSAVKIGGWAPHELHVHQNEEVARDRAEGIRLAYVAATRARDLLVVPAIGDEPWEGGWCSPLNQALYPDTASRRTGSAANGCPKFTSKDSVLERPNGEPATTSTVAPGRHTFAAGYDVVWWDPGPGGKLRLDAKAPFGVRRHDLIVKDVPRDLIAGGRSRYDRWRLSRHDAIARGSVASERVLTAREWAAAVPSPEAPAVHVPEVDAISVRVVDMSAEPSAVATGGTAYGLLVHAVLAKISFEADDAELRSLCDSEAARLGLDEGASAAAATAVKRVLQHDIGRMARAAARAKRCRRETPITYTAPDGTLIEGIVDLAIEHQDGWEVVDFKTDRAIGDESDATYRRQVAVYALAIAAATGRPATATILRV